MSSHSDTTTYVPDLDCADIRFTNFKVLPPDPQHFDGDHNGVGCET
jgi:micrococcal nuclease